MKFDTSEDVDWDAPAVRADLSFCMPNVQNAESFLCVHPAFESAPDDMDETPRTGGKAARFSSSFHEGQQAESRFFQAAERQGWTHVPTSMFDDRVRRIDAAFSISDLGVVTFDIKAAKKLSRSDVAPQYRFHWLELHDTGSLFSGESTMLAMEVGVGAFALVSKAELRAWIPSRIKGPRVGRSSQALFRPYQRDGKLREWITLVDMEELHPFVKMVVH
jgi:hypothetical protein